MVEYNTGKPNCYVGSGGPCEKGYCDWEKALESPHLGPDMLRTVNGGKNPCSLHPENFKI